jgi:hypothetical protein
MSAKDMGDILFQVIWYYLRWHPSTNNNAKIPGIKAATMSENDNNTELDEKCRKRLLSICDSRLKVLENAAPWHQSLLDAMSKIQ